MAAATAEGQDPHGELRVGEQSGTERMGLLWEDTCVAWPNAREAKAKSRVGILQWVLPKYAIERKQQVRETGRAIEHRHEMEASRGAGSGGEEWRHKETVNRGGSENARLVNLSRGAQTNV